jgi:hypothetical protein
MSNHSREEFHSLLAATTGAEHIYYQPPASVKMRYDAIRYKKNVMNVQHADDKSYLIRDEYQIIFITRDPDSPVP